MKCDILRTQSGIALITAMMLALIAMAIAVATVYMILQSTEVSGMKKRYTTAVGGAKCGIVADAFIISEGGVPSSIAGMVFISNLNCFYKKIKNKTSDWGICDNGFLVNSSSYDLRVQCDDFTVYGKIVDTIPGNTEVGESLEVSGVVSTGSFIRNPVVIPYMYRIEVRSQGPAGETAEVSGLYAN